MSSANYKHQLWYCGISLSIIVIHTYLQWKTCRSGELQTSNLTAPQWQPPLCFTTSICKSKRDNHFRSAWLGLLSVHKGLLRQVQQQRAKNEPDLKAVVQQHYVFMKLDGLVTALNSFNQSATTQAKDQLNNHMHEKPFSCSSIWPKCKLCVYKLKVEWLSQKNPRCNFIYQVDKTFISLLPSQGSAISCPNERFSWNTSKVQDNSEQEAGQSTADL